MDYKKQLENAVFVLALFCVIEAVALMLFTKESYEFRNTYNHKECKKQIKEKMDSISYYIDTTYNIQTEIKKLKKDKK